MIVTRNESGRVFTYNGIVLPDPSPEMSVEDVRDFYATQYPELANAAIEEPEPAGKATKHAFTRKVGTKG
jgi:PRTRC genetic system protein C